MKILLLSNLLLFTILGYTQNKKIKGNFDIVITEVKGDLNKDNLIDKVVVSQDTINEKSPYKLEIFFCKTDGNFELFTSSTKIIEPKYPDGKDIAQDGNGFSEIIIKKGVLVVSFELLRGHFEHKFRFQNKNFELTGYTYVCSNSQGEMTSIDFNLSTGIRIEKLERYDSDEVISYSKKKILIRPLPKFEDVEPFENELY